jgi:hypothetical protein
MSSCSFFCDILYDNIKELYPDSSVSDVSVADNAVTDSIAAVSCLAGILFSFPAGVLPDHVGR